MPDDLPGKGLILTDTSKLRALAHTRTRNLPQGLPQKIKLMVSEGMALFELPVQDPITIGRNSATSHVTVDLSPYNAAEMGISRTHLRIEAFGERLMAKDLETVNGSRLNGTPMTANYVYDLRHGDEIKLGRVKIRIFFVYT